MTRSYPARLDLIHNRLDLIHNRLDFIHSRLDLIHNRLDLIHNRLDLILILILIRINFANPEGWSGIYDLLLAHLKFKPKP